MERETNGFSLPHIFRILKVFQSNIDSLSYSNNYVCLSACSVLCCAVLCNGIVYSTENVFGISNICVRPDFSYYVIFIVSNEVDCMRDAYYGRDYPRLSLSFRNGPELDRGSFSHTKRRRRQLKTIYHCLDMRKVTYFLVKPFRG